MRVAKLILALLIAICFSSPAHSQRKYNFGSKKVPYIEVVDCFKCNDIVISLPHPKYPALVGTGPHIYNGKVGIEVLIDEQGKVGKATGIYGHPYFRPLLEKEALIAIFRPKIIDGKLTKTTGVIVFQIVSRTIKGAAISKHTRIRPKPKSIVYSCGVCNQKAIFLPKPQFPQTALSIGVTGPVNVDVMIDEKGNVVWAKAISGHLFLRPASEKAALLAKFEPFLIGGKPAKVTGTIVYNYVR